MPGRFRAQASALWASASARGDGLGVGVFALAQGLLSKCQAVCQSVESAEAGLSPSHPPNHNFIGLGVTPIFKGEMGLFSPLCGALVRAEKSLL